MDRKVPFAIGEYYHIYNKGAGTEMIFLDDADYERFQLLLYLRNSDMENRAVRSDFVPLKYIERGDSIVDILSYILMPNHFHILVHEKEDGGISKFMARLLTSYSMYFNNKNERKGPLMCRPFRSRHIDTDEYFRHCVTYIHRNVLELKGNIPPQQKINSYTYSSYYDYFTTKRDKSMILNKEALPIDISDLKTIAQMNQVMKKFGDYSLE